MNKLQMLVTDLDGTLLRSDKTVNPTTIDLINNCVTNGMKFSIATGRSLVQAYAILSCIDVKDEKYIIGCNGGFAYDVMKEKYLYISLFNSNVVEQVCKLFIQFQHANKECSLELYITNKTHHEINESYIYENSHGKLEAQKHSKPNGMIAPSKTTFWTNINELDKIKDSVIKIYFRSIESATSNEFKEILASNNIEVTCSSSRSNNIEINPKGVSKGYGVTHLAKMLNVPISNILTTGDGENDISMLTASGMSVTLTTSAANVQQAAKKVIDVPQDIFVESAIKEYLD
ncbi:haloacid dehalogenase [Bacilli bacterium]|nr:haloacid dehalogenase [Bacilli bacterium]